MSNFSNNKDEMSFVPIVVDVDQNPDMTCSNVQTEDLPILPLRDMVLFPGVTMPILVGRKASLALIDEAFANKKHIGENNIKSSKCNVDISVAFSIEWYYIRICR